MSVKLDLIQSMVEFVYHEAVFKDALLAVGKEDICTEEPCSCELLKDRIRKNLRMIICDMIALKNIREKVNS